MDNFPDISSATEFQPMRDSRLFVMWLLGNTCPYKCSYCNDTFNDGTFKYHSLEMVQSGMKLIPDAHVMFSGGEPTYHPDFEEILETKPSNLGVSIISNGARPLAFWERIYPQIWSVILTFHVEYAFSNLDRFIKTASFCKTKLQKINLTMLPERWDDCIVAFNSFREAGLNVSPKPLVQDFGFQSSAIIGRYTDAQREWIASHNKEENLQTIQILDSSKNIILKTNPSALIASKNTNFKGWECHTPKKFLMVDFDGKVYNTSCKQRQLVGTLQEGFIVNSAPMVCQQNFCWCHTDIVPKKVKL